jgi:hypothetical protein
MFSGAAIFSGRYEIVKETGDRQNPADGFPSSQFSALNPALDPL